jgi:hypothetical protein
MYRIARRRRTHTGYVSRVLRGISTSAPVMEAVLKELEQREQKGAAA